VRRVPFAPLPVPRAAALVALLTASLAVTAAAQDPGPSTAGLPYQVGRNDVQYAARAADSILSSGTEGGVSLEAFNGGIATGVYLYGAHAGELESIGYGRDAANRRYLWLSISRGDSLEYMAMLYDVDQDLLPDFLLFRTVDRARRGEILTEFRAPVARATPFDISVQSACQPPRCDPASWTVRERTTIQVPAEWFDAWRPVVSLAATRGERWIGRPVESLPPAPRASGP